MAKDSLLPIIIIVGVVVAIALGNQFGLFATLLDIKEVQIEALGHIWKGTNIGIDQTDQYFRQNSLSGDSTRLSISNEVNPIRTTSSIETQMTLTLEDVNIKELDSLKIFSTTSGNGAARGSGGISIKLQDEFGNIVDLAGIGGGGGKSAGNWAWGGIELDVDRNKKVITSFIGDNIALQTDTSSLTGNKWELKLIFAVKADGSFGGASQSTQFTLIKTEKFLAPIPPPPKPNFKPTTSFTTNIIPRVKSNFGLQSLFAVIGASSLTTGQESSYSATRTVTIDNTFSDGTFTFQWANYILTDKDGNILTEGTWEEISSGVYNKDFKITINKAGEYLLATIIQQHTMNYDLSTGQWAVINENLIFDDAPLKLTVSGPIITSPTPVINQTTGQPVTTTSPIVTTTTGSQPSSQPTITELQPEQIPEQKLVEGTSKTKLLIVSIIVIGLTIYLLFGRN